VSRLCEAGSIATGVILGDPWAGGPPLSSTRQAPKSANPSGGPYQLTVRLLISSEYPENVVSNLTSHLLILAYENRMVEPVIFL